MPLLDDLVKLQFGQPIAGAINQLSSKYLLDSLNSAIEEQRAKESQPVPAQETMQNAVQSAFPNVKFAGLPDLMRQLDRSSSAIQQRQDIYGKFIPALALLNPDLAKAVSQDQFARERALMEPVSQKADILSKMLEVGVRSQDRQDTLAANKQSRFDALMENQRQFDLKLQELKNYHDQMAQYRDQLVATRQQNNQNYSLTLLKQFDTYNDNIARAVAGMEKANADYSKEAKADVPDQQTMNGYMNQAAMYQQIAETNKQLQQRIVESLGSQGPQTVSSYIVGQKYVGKTGTYKYIGGPATSPSSWQKVK